ncbi:uncharacterized protein LOC126782375 isoform X2 [Argentina anserina]|uniref:uncharacterized protein LOC126782375 isoform X2 n=1 Tax=Argentina anserina TaxID=57926 RepID=UPI0021767BEE|nr:uncharacterized protein LOC126782375 isoform X2 [Potentilla anserina]
MALIGRVHPDCVNVANPYHECTENCLRKIAEGKGKKNKKKTDNGGDIKGGEFNKKMAGERRVDATRASNPYHQSGQSFPKITGGAEARADIKESGSILDVPILGGRKEKSRPNTPQDLQNVSDRSVVYPYDSRSSPAKDKVKMETGSVLDDPVFGKRKPVSQPRPVEEHENGKPVAIGPLSFPEKLKIENGSPLDDPIFGRRKPVAEPKPREELDNGSGQGAVNPSGSPLSPSNEIVNVGNGSTLDDLIFGRRKQGSEPKPQEELENVPAVKLENGDYNSYSGPLATVKDASLNKQQNQSSGVMPTSGINKMTPSISLPMHKAGEGATDPPSEKRSFSVSGTPHIFEESDDEDAQSVNSDSSVSVGKYRVKGSLSSILQSIFDKYGDIAASCQLESIVIRSYYLECVCYVVQELKRTSVNQLTRSKLKEMSAMLKDVESSGMDVAWLRLMLNECAESIDLMSQHRAFEVAKANCDRDIESIRKELESQMEALALKEKEVADAKKQVSETRANLRELELKSSSLGEAVSKMKSKVEILQSKPLLDKVL